MTFSGPKEALSPLALLPQPPCLSPVPPGPSAPHSLLAPSSHHLLSAVDGPCQWDHVIWSFVDAKVHPHHGAHKQFIPFYLSADSIPLCAFASFSIHF